MFSAVCSRWGIQVRSGSASYQHTRRSIFRARICGGMAFVTSLLRNLMGTGTLLAFPGSMCGAFLCGILYKYGKRLPLHMRESCLVRLWSADSSAILSRRFLWEVKVRYTGLYSRFFVSSFGGTIIAAVLVTAMKRMKVFDIYLGNLEPKVQAAGAGKKQD